MTKTKVDGREQRIDSYHSGRPAVGEPLIVEAAEYAMGFEMSELPLADPRVAAIVGRFLKTCGGAVDIALEESRTLMPDAEWRVLRRGFGQVLGSEIFDMWRTLVRHHPECGEGYPPDAKGRDS